MFDNDPKRRKTFLAAIFFLIVAAMLAGRVVPRWHVPGDADDKKWALRDFSQAIYHPCAAFFNGDNPYHDAVYRQKYPVKNHFALYSPITLLIHAPFTLLPYTWAARVYVVAMVAMAVVLAYLTLRFCKVRVQLWMLLAVAALLLVSRPVHKNLLNGQCALQATLFSLVAIQLAAKRPLVSGIALALSTFKPTFGVPIFLLMLCRRNYRACLIAVTVGGIVTLALVGVLAAQVGGLAALIALVPERLAETGAHPGSHPLTSYSRVDAFALLSRILGWVPPGRAELAVSLAVLGIGAFALWRWSAIAKTDQDAAGLSGALICATTLFAVHHQAYDLSLLSVMFTAALLGSFFPWSAIRGRTRALLIVMMGFLAVNYLSSASGIRALQIEGHAFTLVASLNGLAMSVVFVTCVLLVFRKQLAGELDVDHEATDSQPMTVTASEAILEPTGTLS